MKFPASALAFCPSLLAAVASAQGDGTAAPASPYPLQSDPFFLKLQSSTAELDGQYLASYHSGAAIEQLGLDGREKPSDTRLYYLNYTSYAPEVDEEPVGILTWNLPLGNDPFKVSSGLVFQKNETSDVTMMVFYPGPPQEEQMLVGFDAEEKLFAYVDGEAVQEWFFCSTYYGGYNYNALTWVEGGVATHESCHGVDVVREFSG